MEKSRSLILKEAKELRQEYYYCKQKLTDFKAFIENYENILLKSYFSKEGVEDYLISTYLKAIEMEKYDSFQLAQLKKELDKLPHIPNKQELKEIRRQKHKANNNK